MLVHHRMRIEQIAKRLYGIFVVLVEKMKHVRRQFPTAVLSDSNAKVNTLTHGMKLSHMNGQIEGDQGHPDLDIREGLRECIPGFHRLNSYAVYKRGEPIGSP